MTDHARWRTRSRAGAVLFTATAIVLVVASTAWACTAFLGRFEVRGDVGGTVTAIGNDVHDESSGAGSFTMRQQISGSTEATSGVTAAANGTATGTVSIKTTDAKGQKIPSSDYVYVGRALGNYWVNFANGPAYLNHDQWVLDCMTYLDERTMEDGTFGEGRTEIEKIGEADVDDSGAIVATFEPDGTSLDDKDGSFWTFPLPDTSVPMAEGAEGLDGASLGEAAICISDDRGYFGNQVPITTL